MKRKARGTTSETCAICGCTLHRNGGYAQPTVQGRSHATAHHFVPERFFGRSTNRRGSRRHPVFATCPWGVERKTAIYCYDCHEELLHNPVLLREDVDAFAELVRLRGLAESVKEEDRANLAGRIELLHEVIARGIRSVLEEERARRTADTDTGMDGP